MSYPRFKQKCAICKKNMVVMFSYKQFPICSECQMKRISDPVTDPKYKKILDIPRELYEKSLFLRNIKESYVRFGSLTENQISAFKKVVEDVKKPRPVEDVKDEPIVITDDIYSRPKRKSRKIKSPIRTPIKTPERIRPASK